MNTKDLIDQVNALPTEDRALVADSLLRSLNPTNSEIDRKWVDVARTRLEEMKAGAVEGIPGTAVFEAIRNQYRR